MSECLGAWMGKGSCACRESRKPRANQYGFQRERPAINGDLIALIKGGIAAGSSRCIEVSTNRLVVPPSTGFGKAAASFPTPSER